jgi:hypothetical protein
LRAKLEEANAQIETLSADLATERKAKEDAEVDARGRGEGRGGERSVARGGA